MYHPHSKQPRLHQNSGSLTRRYSKDSSTRLFIKDCSRGITTYIALDNNRRSHK